MKPPQTIKTSITNDSSESLSNETAHWGSDFSSTYEILRREGEIHEGRTTVIDELQRNFARLEDLHGQLHFILREVESVLRMGNRS